MSGRVFVEQVGTDRRKGKNRRPAVSFVFGQALRRAFQKCCHIVLLCRIDSIVPVNMRKSNVLKIVFYQRAAWAEAHLTGFCSFPGGWYLLKMWFGSWPVFWEVV